MEREARLERLEKKLDTLLAVHEIQNLMGRLMYWFEGGEYEKTLTLFAQDRADVSAEAANHGQRSGPEGVREMMVDFWEKQYAGHAREMRRLYPGDENEDGRNGLLDLRCLGSPVIEVAEDLQTAKGMWYAPTVATECHPGEERPSGHALWMKFAVDFIREDGAWKIWHYHALPSFNTPWGKDWVEASLAAEARMANLPPEAKAAMAPKGPITAYHAYSVHTSPACDPPPPEPYGTFSETFRY